MKYLKKYEDLSDPFYKNELFWIELTLTEGSEDKISTDIKDIASVLDERQCEYRLYYHTSENENQYSSFVFLTPDPVENFELPDKIEFHEMNDTTIPENMEDYRIAVDDIETIFNTNKFNL